MIKSKIRISIIILLLFGGVASFAASYFITTSAFQSEFPQIIPIILGAFFAVFGLISIGSLFFTDKLELDEEKLVIKNIFNQVKNEVFIADIKTYSLILNEKKPGEEKLVIFFDSKEYELEKQLLSNYSLFKNILTASKTRDDNYEKQKILKYKKYGGYFYIAIGIMLLGFYFVSIKDKVNPNLSLVEIEGTINQDLRINQRKTKRSKPYVYIKLKEFPKFNFEINNYVFEAANIESLRHEIQIGDIVSVEIVKEDYDKKITKKEDLSFSDKSVNYENIKVYSFKKDSINFINKELSNHLYEKGNEHNWIMPLLFLVLILYGVYFVLSKK